MPFSSQHSSHLSTPISLVVTSVLSGTAHVGQCHGFAPGLSNTSDLALEAPLPCLWTCTAPRAGCSINDNWQFHRWYFGCQICSPSHFWSFCDTQGFHRSMFAEHETYRVSTKRRDWFFGVVVWFFFDFASDAPGFFHLVALELGFLFILCSFLFMHCLCPAVVCCNDTWFIFLSLAGNKGWWESNADHPPPPYYCTFWGHRVVCICRREWCWIQETWSQDIFYSMAVIMQDCKKCLCFKMFYLMFKG